VAEYPTATVLPGLIDTHVHLVAGSGVGALDRVPGLGDDELDTVITEGLRRQLAAGVTTVRDLGDLRYAVVNRRDVQRAGRTREPEPTIVASGPPLTSVDGHCHFLGGEVANRDQISAAMREHVQRGVDVVKVMASGGMFTPGSDVMGTQFSADNMRSMVELAHDAGLPITAHAHSLAAVEQSVDAGVDCIEHCSCVTEKDPYSPTNLWPALPIGTSPLAPCSTPIRKWISAKLRQLSESGSRPPDGLHSGYASAALTCCVDYTREVYALSPELTPESIPGWLMGTFTVGCRSSRTQASHRRKLSPRPLRKRPVFVG
jgi:hypothetical protein